MSEKEEGDKYFSNMSLADLQHGLSDLISTPHNFSSLFFLFSQICSKLFSYKAVQYGSDLDGALWFCPSLHCKIMPLRHLLHLVHDSMSWLIWASSKISIKKKAQVTRQLRQDAAAIFGTIAASFLPALHALCHFVSLQSYIPASGALDRFTQTKTRFLEIHIQPCRFLSDPSPIIGYACH